MIHLSDLDSVTTSPPASVRSSTSHTSNIDHFSDLDSVTTSPPASVRSSGPSEYTFYHVFFPPVLLYERDHDWIRKGDPLEWLYKHRDEHFASAERDLESLPRVVCAAAQAYTPHVSGTVDEARWHRITKLLDNLQASLQFAPLDKDHIITQLHGMQTEDILVFYISSHNAAIILTKGERGTLFEAFEVASNETAPGSSNEASEVSTSDEMHPVSLRCSYPRSAVEIPNGVFDHADFQLQLANFLSLSGVFNPDFPPSAYITALLAGIIQGIGHPADAPCITKRVRAKFQSGDRRSSLWLLFRVAIQMAVDRSSLGRTSYKRFMLYCLCTLAMNGKSDGLPRDMLQVMSDKILRRLTKLGSLCPDWLSEMALGTCARLRDILDAGWKPLLHRPSPFRNPSQDELARDSQLSLPNSREYIRNSLTSPARKPTDTSFCPNHHRRGTIWDFLSTNGSFFDEAFKDDPIVALYDVQQAVEQGIDEWLACITNVDDACTQLQILIARYPKIGSSGVTSEEQSIQFLTVIELIVALDKLVLREIPILADYSPEIPLSLLQQLLLRKPRSLHRLSCVYQYLSARHSQSRPGWSVLSQDFTEDSFPVRYYDHSLYLQQLKLRIEEDSMKKEAIRPGLQLEPGYGGFSHIQVGDDYQEDQPRRRVTGSTRVFGSPLPALLLHAKVVVFELQSPNCFRSWRSAIASLRVQAVNYISDCALLMDDPELRPYQVRPCNQAVVDLHLAYYNPKRRQTSPNDWTLSFVFKSGSLNTWQLREPFNHNMRDSEYLLGIWEPNSTTHSPNDVLAAQVNCPTDFSIDEFIAFGHLRSGGSLQWLNILQGLRSRTLNLRSRDVRRLLSYAALQVGPLDLNTGLWIWHQELQDPSFCDALLDELEGFLDVSARSIDATMMYTISLLLACVLASSPSDHISDKTITFLRRIRKKIFGWMQDMVYDMTLAPANEARVDLLLDMAATCRNTFDVDPATFLNHSQTAEDVDALLSGTFFVRALSQRENTSNSTIWWRNPSNPTILLQNQSLSLSLEDRVKDVILRDPSDYGVDLAVAKIFPSYRLVASRWEPLQNPNGHWLKCKAKSLRDDYILQTVHINLLDGELRVDGQLCGSLPDDIASHPEFRRIFPDQHPFVMRSDLPGMDFMILNTIFNYKVHLSLKKENLVLLVQGATKDEILELIPSEVLKKDLPPALVDGHVHLMNVSSKVIEIRPLTLFWEESPENWRIDCASGQYCLYKGRETLIDIHSPTWAMLASCFKSLQQKTKKPNLSGSLDSEDLDISRILESEVSDIFGSLDSKDSDLLNQSTDLLITTMPINSDNSVLVPGPQLSVTLPQYDLSFFLNEKGELESCDFKDMVYDEDQSIGTLFGFANLLVLRPKTRFTGSLIPEALIPRRALILDGNVKPRGSRVLDMNEGREYYTYEVDTELGCMMGDGTLASTQFLAEAHVKTSYHRPDPLTSKTGVQEQHRLLQSGACWSVTGRASNSGSAPPPKDVDYSMPELVMDLTDIVSTAASVIYVNAPTIDTILRWAEIWTASMPLNADLQVDQILWEGICPRFQLLFGLPTIAWRSPSYPTAFLSMLIAFAMEMHSHSKNPPIHSGCKIGDGYRPTRHVVRHHIQMYCAAQDVTPESWSIDITIEDLLKNWVCNSPPTISLDHFHVAGLTASLQQLFDSCYRNWNLKERLTHLLTSRPRQVLPARYIFLDSEHVPFQWVTLEQLLSERPAPNLQLCNTLPWDRHMLEKSNDILPLDRLLSSLHPTSSIEQEYLASLETKAERSKNITTTRSWNDDIGVLSDHYTQCRGDYMDALGELRKSLGPTTDREQMLECFGKWPSITGDILLRLLASTSPINLPRRWKKCLISLALLLLEVQHARRLLRFALYGLEEEFLRELENEHCDGWDPEEHPDWLLIQIQGNFLIRRNQVEAAMEMISPRSGKNTVLQVNMGEGKSSVIIPIVAATLADGKQLVRIVVPKALTAQMFSMLISRLGGLTNRPIYCLPFSRANNNFDISGISEVCKLMSKCMTEHGILLVQPEHVVSLKLLTVEKQIREGEIVAKPYSKPQKTIYGCITTALSSELTRIFPGNSLVSNVFRWLGQSLDYQRTEGGSETSDHKEDVGDFSDLEDSYTEWPTLSKRIHSHVRDILDESDEVLHSRFQLIYTIGLEQHMDGYPSRWVITQRILWLATQRAHALSRHYPSSVEYEHGPPGSFPHICIVRTSNVGKLLISMIVEDVMAGRLPNFDFRHLSPELRGAIRSFISDENVLQVPDTAERVEEFARCSDRTYLWGGLLLLRGLLSSNVLLSALTERRWRVDYGPSSSEGSKLAVPYRAKDVPAVNTQFSHPDLAIILTCLSYYHSGLDEQQLRVAFEDMLGQDDPYKEYALWVEGYDLKGLPDSLRKLSDLNLRSSEQWDNVIFPLFSRNQATINFYLARVVFPKEAKEYQWKLCGSSWDLAEEREKLITGFSGTNDGRWLLPTSVIQYDLDHERGTNGKILAYLLQPENDFCAIIHNHGERQTTQELLRLVAVQIPKIYVFLDVGAQILDLSNRQVAETWLNIARDRSGAVYFSTNDELMVVTRNGVTRLLSSSPLSQHLDQCVVYLDHPHTRGTDLKLPVGSRAAVTLGPKVTKDALVQGCMRMRKLGHGHSVMFFAPPGVVQSIRVATGKQDPNASISTADVLSWAIHETWTDIQQRAPYWALQGVNHKTRHDAWTKVCKGDITSEQLSAAWVQPEAKSLAELYAPRETKGVESDLSIVPGMQQRCKDLGVLSLPSAQLEEEHEREVNHEREREREVELPPKATPAVHSLHPDVLSFVKTGIIPPVHSDSAFLPVFTTLKRSSAAPSEADVWSPFILATVDFYKTIEPDSTQGTMDQYLRPVQWILSSTSERGQILVLLSPFEADRLMEDIRASEFVHLHLYAPRTAQRMKPSDDLRLYVIPPLPSDWRPPWDLIDQLNVFAGQLYLRDYQSYLRVCRFLGVPTGASTDGTAIRRNLFNIPGSFDEMEITFSDSPLPSVMALLAVRNRGRPFADTHMGRILQGQILTEKDFDVPTLAPP